MFETIELILRICIALPIAFYMGKLMTKIRLPAILGWLLTGMIVGPYAFKILNEHLLSTPWYHIIVRIAECTFGVMLGKELIFKKLQHYGKQIIVITIFESLGTFAVVSLCFSAIFYFTGLPMYVALIFGGIALATAPAPALSVVNEFKTKGPVTDALIPITILDDVIAIVVFFSINSFIVSKGSGQSASILAVLLQMVLLPLAMGAVIGFIASPIFKKSRSQIATMILVACLIILSFLIGYFVDNFLLAQPSINYMLLGMAVFAAIANSIPEQNMDSLSKASNPLVGAGMLFLIMNLGAPLDYNLIIGAGLLTGIYIISRAFGKYYSTRLGAKLTNSAITVQKYLGLTLLPHSGISLFFTGVAVSSLHTFDSASALIVQGTISAAAVINEVFAVLLAKKGFELAGEIDKHKDAVPAQNAPQDIQIITISRQYGSGGSSIGNKLAEELGIPIYDKLLFTETSKNSDIPESFIKDAESNSISPFSQIFDSAVNDVFSPTSNHVFMEQSKTILALAQKGPCIIVGRGGNHILRESHNVLSIYIYADLEKRIERIINDYGVDESNAKKLIHLTDENRAAYIKTYINEDVGDVKNYHLCIDSGLIGIDGAVELIKSTYLQGQQSKKSKNNSKYTFNIPNIARILQKRLRTSSK